MCVAQAELKRMISGGKDVITVHYFTLERYQICKTLYAIYMHEDKNTRLS